MVFLDSVFWGSVPEYVTVLPDTAVLEAGESDATHRVSEVAWQVGESGSVTVSRGSEFFAVDTRADFFLRDHRFLLRLT